MGVKTGDNGAFFLDVKRVRANAVETTDGLHIPLTSVCRCVRGRDVRRWTIAEPPWMLWPPARRLAQTAALGGALRRSARRRRRHAALCSTFAPSTSASRWSGRISRAASAPPCSKTPSRLGDAAIPLVPNQTLYALDAAIDRRGARARRAAQLDDRQRARRRHRRARQGFLLPLLRPHHRAPSAAGGSRRRARRGRALLRAARRARRNPRRERARRDRSHAWRRSTASRPPSTRGSPRSSARASASTAMPDLAPHQREAVQARAGAASPATAARSSPTTSASASRTSPRASPRSCSAEEARSRSSCPRRSSRSGATRCATSTSTRGSSRTTRWPAIHSLPATATRFIVVDEAHAFRNRRTQRWCALARRSIGARLLLVTATPICNSADDLLALVSLIAADDALRRLRRRLDRRRLRHPRRTGARRHRLASWSSAASATSSRPSSASARSNGA